MTRASRDTPRAPTPAVRRENGKPSTWCFARRVSMLPARRENARFVKVTHNGRVIHENVELTGPTRAATYENDEKPTGPSMLQGDHGPVAYRNLQLKPVVIR